MGTMKTNMIPPNGGWGWMIVFGVALTNSFNQSLVMMYGLIFGVKLEEMGETTVGAALVGNIMLLVTNFSGLIAGPALKICSARQVSIIASLLSGLGMISASFSTKMWHLIVTYSIFTGLGIGLLQASTFLAVNAYFTTRRGVAVGISMAGTGIGQMLMPHLVRFLLDEYGFKGTALVMGALAFNGIVGASLFQPVEWHLKPENIERQPLLDKTDERHIVESEDAEESHVKGLSLSEPSNFNDVDRYSQMRRSYSTCTVYSHESEVITSKKPQGFCEKFKNFFDLDLLLDLVFWNIIFGCGLGFAANQNFNMLFPFFLQQQVGLDRLSTAMCMSALAAADIVARIVIPMMTDKFHIPSRYSFFVGCVTVTIARTVLTLQTEYTALLLASAMNGFFRSSIIINQSLIVSEYIKKDVSKLPSALGINMVMKGISIITFGQLLGWIRDYYQSYIICFHAQNLLLIIIIILWLSECLYKCYRSRSER